MSTASRRRRRSGGGGGGGHDGGGMMRWLLTYADMITLLLVFFIVLYALSKINEAKYKSLMEALHAALHGQTVSTVGTHHRTRAIYPPPATKPTPAPKENLNTSHLLKQLRAVVRKDHLQAQLSVQSVPQGVLVVIHTGVLFPLAQATIEPGAAKVLGDVGKVLAAVPNEVVVQGFTDNQPIRTPIFHSNWDLSAARAARVVDFWAAQGLDQSRFIVEGFGQFSPVATNSTAAGRSKNRRVDVVVLKNAIVPQTTVVVGSG